ncbi:flavodoxin [Salinibius halmophilus]|uniref:flavodoxin n=1 Tax=Salinibius halmophilus TaxID=1853216 RepID=UPI000E66608A|nr:flavodoxin [Salinibius halmophilus]
MADILLVYGTDTGNTEDVADRLQARFAELGVVVECVNVTDVDAETLLAHQTCIFGIPTWDFGGIQADWEGFEPVLQEIDWQHHHVALYGLGDQFGYGDYFIDAVGWLHEILQPRGANIVGYWPTEGYEFDGSRALSADKKHFYGLAIDEDQQFELTDQRLDEWVEQLKHELPLLAAATA